VSKHRALYERHYPDRHWLWKKGGKPPRGEQNIIKPQVGTMWAYQTVIEVAEAIGTEGLNHAQRGKKNMTRQPLKTSENDDDV